MRPTNTPPHPGASADGQRGGGAVEQRDTRELTRKRLEEAFSLAVLGSGESWGWELVTTPRTDEELLTFTARGANHGTPTARANQRVLSGRANLLGAKLVSNGPKSGKRSIHAVVLFGVLGPGLIGMGRVHALASSPQEHLREGRPLMARFFHEDCHVQTILAIEGTEGCDDSLYMEIDFMRFPRNPHPALHDAFAVFCGAFGFAYVAGDTPKRPPLLVSRSAVPKRAFLGLPQLRLTSATAGGSAKAILPVGELELHGEAEFDRIV